MIWSLFRSSSTHAQLLGRAEALIPMANVVALRLLPLLLEGFPTFQTVISNSKDIEQFDFVVTVAGVHVAAVQLDWRKRNERELLKRVEKCLSEAFPKYGMKVIWECQNAVEATPDIEIHQSFGAWIFIRLFDRPPETDDDFRLLNFAGIWVVKQLLHWWNVDGRYPSPGDKGIETVYEAFRANGGDPGEYRLLVATERRLALEKQGYLNADCKIAGGSKAPQTDK